MRIDVLALDGVFDLGLAAILDVFQTANELAGMSGLAVPKLEVRTIGMRRVVRTAHGLRVPLVPAANRRPECIVAPALGFKMPEPLERALARPEVRDAALALK